MLLQLREPGETPVPHEDEADLAVGIDLGTTHSLVAISRQQQVDVLTSETGEKLIPSVLFFQGDDAPFLGGREAKERLQTAPTLTLTSVKRFMGGRGGEGGSSPPHLSSSSKGEGCQDQPRFCWEKKAYTPVELSAEILKVVKSQAEKALSQGVTRAVITVPAYFDDTARTATRDAARLAGLEVLRLLNEPTAAALAYGLDQQSEGLYAVYDLGGGTFDVSLLRFSQGIFQVLATGGDTFLGGDDFDEALLTAILSEHAQQGGSKALSTGDRKKALDQMRQIREGLTTQDSLRFTFSGQEHTSTHHITQEDLTRIAAPLVQRTLDHFEAVLSDADVDISALKGVILVGGATRMPCVLKGLARFGVPLLKELDPDFVVAQGAALQAEALTKGSDTLLLDVAPLSLGIETMGDLTEKIIPRNSPLPISKAQEFTTYQEGQTALSLHIIQGERELASDCCSLAKFELQGIPPMAAGAARIEVTFTVDADGLLTVSAKEKTTGVSQRVEVKPTYGLSQEEVADLIRQAYETGSDDMKNRLLQEARVEAKRLIVSVQAALQQDADLLTKEERGSIDQKIKNLQSLCSEAERDEILSEIKALEKATQDFAARRMQAHLNVSLQGRQLSDIEG